MKSFDVHLEDFRGEHHADITVKARNAAHAINVASALQNAADPSAVWIVSRVCESVTQV